MRSFLTVVTVMLMSIVVLPYAATAASWEVPGDYATIQAAIDDPVVIDGDSIVVGPGNYAGAKVNKRVEIRGEGQAVINSGPAHGSGLIQGFRLLTGSNGATFSHLTFTVDLAIINGDGVDEVTVTQCTFLNAVQAISNWRGNGWEITHNVITDLRTRCGGGIGILIGDYSGGTVSDNVVSHNKISGTLHVPADDCGGYNGSGIVLYADFRWGALGATEISFNRILKNKIALTSDTPVVVEVAASDSSSDGVDVVAIELTEARDDTDPHDPVITDNGVGFNDLRGTALQIVLTPSTLDDVNDISRNLGENRGHGLHPSAFRIQD